MFIGARLAAMNITRIPEGWLSLRPGDRVATTMPYHRIDSIFRRLEGFGYKFSSEPSRRGYWVICEQAPRVSSDGRAIDQPLATGEVIAR